MNAFFEKVDERGFPAHEVPDFCDLEVGKGVRNR